MANKLTNIPLPPSLRKPEITEAQGFLDSEQRERKRWSLLDDWNWDFYSAIINIIGGADTCNCFRWIYSTLATVDDTGLGAQTDFVLPLPYELEDSIFHIVYARTSFLYYNVDYTINVATNTLTIPAGVLLGYPITIFAVKHDDIQDIYYDVALAGAAPYLYSPPVTVDRAPGRQLVFARTSPRYLDSGRLGDQYTISNTANTLSLTAGLGVGHRTAIHRLRECGVIAHEEILATAPGQTVFNIANLDHRVQPHDTLRNMVFARTSYKHAGFDYVTDSTANTVTLLNDSLDVDQPLNIWIYR